MALTFSTRFDALQLHDSTAFNMIELTESKSRATVTGHPPEGACLDCLTRSGNFEAAGFLGRQERVPRATGLCGIVVGRQLRRRWRNHDEVPTMGTLNLFSTKAVIAPNMLIAC